MISIRGRWSDLFAKTDLKVVQVDDFVEWRAGSHQRLALLLFFGEHLFHPNDGLGINRTKTTCAW